MRSREMGLESIVENFNSGQKGYLFLCTDQSRIGSLMLVDTTEHGN